MQDDSAQTLCFVIMSCIVNALIWKCVGVLPLFSKMTLRPPRAFKRRYFVAINIFEAENGWHIPAYTKRHFSEEPHSCLMNLMWLHALQNDLDFSATWRSNPRVWAFEANYLSLQSLDGSSSAEWFCIWVLFVIWDVWWRVNMIMRSKQIWFWDTSHLHKRFFKHEETLNPVYLLMTVIVSN